LLFPLAVEHEEPGERTPVRFLAHFPPIAETAYSKW